jgi:hypothetical protein
MSSTLKIVLFCFIISLGVNYYIYNYHIKDKYIKNETHTSLILKEIVHKLTEQITKDKISKKFNISEENIEVNDENELIISNMSDNDMKNLKNDYLFRDCLFFYSLMNKINDNSLLCIDPSILTNILKNIPIN